MSVRWVISRTFSLVPARKHKSASFANVWEICPVAALWCDCLEHFIAPSLLSNLFCTNSIIDLFTQCWDSCGSAGPGPEMERQKSHKAFEKLVKGVLVFFSPRSGYTEGLRESCKNWGQRADECAVRLIKLDYTEVSRLLVWVWHSF